MTTRYHKSEFLTFASCQLVAASNEDRISTCMNHVGSDHGSFSSFCVFDGHQGVSAADRCSASLANIAVSNCNALLTRSAIDKSEAVEVSLPSEISDNRLETKLDQLDQQDAIVCEAIRKACSQIGHEVRGMAESGTTVNTLFLRWGDGLQKGTAGTVRCPVRAYCANVGDSRCIMLKSYETKQALVTSTFVHSRSQTDLHSLSSVKPTSPKSTSAMPSYSVNGVEILPAASSSPKSPALNKSNSTSSGKLMSLGSTKSSTDHRFVAVHLFSEDHKLSLHRERLRIYNTSEGKIPAGNETECWHVLPADASAIYIPYYAKTLPPESFLGLPSCGLNFAENTLDISTSSQRSGPFGRRTVTGPSLSASAHGRLDASVDPSVVTAQNRSAFDSRSSQHGMNIGMNSRTGPNYSVKNQSMDRRTDSIDSNLSFNGQSSHHSKNSENRNGVNSYFIFDWGYPDAEIEKEARTFIAKLTHDSPSSPGKAFYDKNTDHELHKSSDPDDPTGPPLCYKISFIKKRSNKAGSAVGPEALFSRHNTSIMMTRSLGDRFGPRSCIAVPEISAYTIPVDTHVRFIMASDGFWDVVSIETVRCVGLNDKYKDPRILAAQLAQKAQRRRDRGCMRPDDITVIVVDVNPLNFITVGGKLGGSGAMGGDSGKDKCIMS